MAGRILIADDLATNRIVLRVKLAAASYEVCQATSADELRRAVRQAPPDLVIIDSAFDGDRAIDICQDLLERPESHAIPVLILAADYSPSDRLAALHAGVCDVLEKPVDNAEFLARVRNILRTRSVEQELALRTRTACELGFQEAATPFERPAQVMVVGEAISRRDALQAACQAGTDTKLAHVAAEEALEVLAGLPSRPDVIILPTDADAQPGSLFLLAELRSRAQSRDAAIIAVCPAGDARAAVSALDTGANDAVDTSIAPAELGYRLKRQFERKRNADRLRNTLEDGLRMAVTDPLTGLFNRRYALPHLARVAREAAETGRPYAVMVLDLDRFKRINDSYGHAAGDRVLQEVAARMKANIRNVDLIARVGGEEFLVVMPDTDLTAARVAAERLRDVIRQTPIAIGPGSDPVSVTASIGVSMGQAGPGEAVEDMMARADTALLGAKSTGRNQVIFENAA